MKELNHQNQIIMRMTVVNIVAKNHADASSAYARYKQPYCADAYFSIWQPPQIA